MRRLTRDGRSFPLAHRSTPYAGTRDAPES
jgi:hypothetical protein